VGKLAKSLEDKARDKKPLVRSSVATDENAPLKLLEMLSNDLDDMVRGDVAINESASEGILRKLSKDGDESVRCAVASNRSTPLDVLAVLLVDKSKYVKQNAKDNPNSKKIGANPKTSGKPPQKNASSKIIAVKAKPVKDGFTSQEVTVSLFSYTPAEFKKIKLKTELKKWVEDLDSNSSSYPTYVGSPFDDSNLNLDTTDDGELDEGTIYVVPHYYYESSKYAIEGKIDLSWSITLAPIVGLLLKSMPMDYAQKEDEQMWFEGQGATEGTEPEVSFYAGSRLIASFPLEDFDEKSLKEITLAL
jgi:hypothetical protein